MEAPLASATKRRALMSKENAITFRAFAIAALIASALVESFVPTSGLWASLGISTAAGIIAAGATKILFL